MSAARVPAAQGSDRALAAFEGRVLIERRRGADPVNVPMIRHWVEAMGMDGGIHLDPDAARAAGRAGVVAPAAKTQAWTMRGYAATVDPGPPVGGAAELIAALDAAGYTSVVATDSDFAFERELVPGDEVWVEEVVESISPEKRTGLGTGRFITTVRRYTDGGGTVVATQRWRTLRFAPRPSETTPQHSEEP